MRPTLGIALVGLALGIGGCAMGVANTESLLAQSGFRKLAADTPPWAQHVQTMAPHRLIKRKADGKTYYVYADPDQCKCLFVGNESAYATYKGMVQRQEDAMALEEAREQEGFEGVK